MRTTLVILAFVLTFLPFAARAVTLRNHDAESYRVVVCDEACRQTDEDDRDPRDFWVGPRESRTFGCHGRCFVGIYRNGAPPSYADMAAGDEDAFYRGDETAEIVAGQIRRRR